MNLNNKLLIRYKKYQASNNETLKIYFFLINIYKYIITLTFI